MGGKSCKGDGIGREVIADDGKGRLDKLGINHTGEGEGETEAEGECDVL